MINSPCTSNVVQGVLIIRQTRFFCGSPGRFGKENSHDVWISLTRFNPSSGWKSFIFCVLPKRLSSSSFFAVINAICSNSLRLLENDNINSWNWWTRKRRRWYDTVVVWTRCGFQIYHQLNWCSDNGSGTREESFAKWGRYSPILVVRPDLSSAQLMFWWWSWDTRRVVFAKWGRYSLISNPLPNSSRQPECCEEGRSVFLVIPGVSKSTQNHSSELFSPSKVMQHNITKNSTFSFKAHLQSPPTTPKTSLKQQQQQQADWNKDLSGGVKNVCIPYTTD